MVHEAAVALDTVADALGTPSTSDSPQLSTPPSAPEGLVQGNCCKKTHYGMITTRFNVNNFFCPSSDTCHSNPVRALISRYSEVLENKCRNGEPLNVAERKRLANIIFDHWEESAKLAGVPLKVGYGKCAKWSGFVTDLFPKEFYGVWFSKSEGEDSVSVLHH